MQNLASLRNRLHSLIWESQPDQQPLPRMVVTQAARIAWVIGRDLLDGRLNLRAMSLVYTTLLSIVPALAISFAIFRLFGFDNHVQQFLTQFLSPLGSEGNEVTARIMEFVTRINANVLGTVGFAFLLYTVISMVGKIEEAFNTIWHVTANRSFTRQFTEVLSMGVLALVVVFTVLGFMASLVSESFLGGFAQYGPIRFFFEQMNLVVPYLLLIGTFAFLYVMIPNTHVRITSALVGASVAGFVWGAAGWAFATFVVKSAQYVAIYSAFAGLVVFMIWLYAAWLILLVGCSISFYFQHRRRLSPELGLGLLNLRQRQRLAVQILLLVHEAFAKGEEPWTYESIAKRISVPVESVQEIAAILADADLVGLAAKPGRLLPSRAAALVPIREILDAVLRRSEFGSVADKSIGLDPRVESFFAELTAAELKLTLGTSIADLLPAAGEKPALVSSR